MSLPNPLYGRIYVEFSDVCWHARTNDTLTGIHRVQLEVGRALAVSSPNVCVFAELRGTFYDLTEIIRDQSASQAYSTIRRIFALPTNDNSKLNIFRKIKFSAVRLAGYIQDLATPHRLTLCKSDVLFIGGAFWVNAGRSLSLMKRASRHGATVVVLIHDVIPVSFPKMTSRGTRRFFNRLFRMRFHAIANSKYTAAELQRFVKGANLCSITVAPLAHEFPGYPRSCKITAFPTDRLAEWSTQAFVICIGTVEIRKNHMFLLDLWSRLKGERGTNIPTLLIAGRAGWLAKKAVERLRAADVESPFRFIESPSDAELAWLYANARFSIFPSLAEGWGLPVGESLWFGTPCISSNVTSLPEVGGDLCLYADPENIDSFAAHVIHMVEGSEVLSQMRARIEKSELRTWRFAAFEIAAHVLHIAML